MRVIHMRLAALTFPGKSNTVADGEHNGFYAAVSFDMFIEGHNRLVGLILGTEHAAS